MATVRHDGGNHRGMNATLRRRSWSSAVNVPAVLLSDACAAHGSWAQSLSCEQDSSTQVSQACSKTPLVHSGDASTKAKKAVSKRTLRPMSDDLNLCALTRQRRGSLSTLRNGIGCWSRRFSQSRENIPMVGVALALPCLDRKQLVRRVLPRPGAKPEPHRYSGSVLARGGPTPH